MRAHVAMHKSHGSTCSHMAKSDETAQLSFIVPRRVKEALQELADADRRNLSNYLQVLLEKHVEQNKSKRI
jgi:hypothetical protein